MPTINKPPKREKKRPSESEMREIRTKAYANPAWKKLRALYIREHPLCEEHLKRNEIIVAQDVHHKKSPFSNGYVNYDLLLSKSNLESLCKECHQQIHNGGIKQSPKEIIEFLDKLLDENTPDEYFDQYDDKGDN